MQSLKKIHEWAEMTVPLGYSEEALVCSILLVTFIALLSKPTA